MSDTYHIATAQRGQLEPEVIGCIELVESSDDGGWYAHEYDFTRKDNATRVSSKIYRTRAELIRALDTNKHKWDKWD